MLGLRDFTESVIRKIFPQPESALVAGVLLGRDNDLPPELVSAYQATGTAHIFAVSGFNIAIMAGVFSAVFRRLFSKWKAALAAILGIIFYTLLVGGSASVVRAAIMGSLGIVAELIGRRSSGVTSLAFTAAVMCLFSPQLPWDVSFQLTFMATLGLMLFATPLEHGLERMLAKRLTSEKARQWAEPIAEYFLFTLAAQAMTLPVIVYHFHRLSITSVLANPLVLPAQPLLMVLSLIATLLGMIWIPLGKLFAYIAWALAAWTNRVVAWIAGWGGNMSFSSVSVWSVIAIYLLIFLLVISYKRWKEQVTLTAGLIAGGLVTLVIWQGVLARPDGRLHVTILGIQDEAALLLETPRGSRILINSVPSSEALGSALDPRLSIFDHRLQAVILTNASAVSLNALASVLQDLPVNAVYWSQSIGDSDAALSLQTYLALSNIPLPPLQFGDRLQLDDGVLLTALSSGDTRTSFKLQYANFNLLMPAGEPPSSVSRNEISGVNVILLGNNDLDSAAPEEWNALGATIFWIEPRNSSPDEHWISLAQKDWLEISTDGQGIWITSK